MEARNSLFDSGVKIIYNTNLQEMMKTKILIH